MKTDLTEYGEEELSLNVFNDEGLYLRRRDVDFLGLIDEIFIYTKPQLEELKNDLIEDENDE